MYVPPHFRAEPHKLVTDLIGRYPFASLITPAGAETKITHLPILYDPPGGEHGNGLVLAHVAKSNPHWKSFGEESESIVLVQGPHAYVSSTWYEPPGFVPTWNYAAVHLYGRPEILDDHETSLLIRRILEAFEPSEGHYDFEAAEESIKAQLPGVVAFRISVTRIEAKFKMSQNRKEEDQIRVIENLEKGSPSDLQVASFMRVLQNAKG